MKGHLANAVRTRTRTRLFYTASIQSPTTTSQFFDAGFTPATPRLVNTAQVTLPSGPSAQQSKGSQHQSPHSSSSHQPNTTSLALVQGPLPVGSSNGSTGSASSRTSIGQNSSNSQSSLLVPSPATYSQPGFFFPSILSSSERTQSRSTFRLESGAYGIPKSRARRPNQCPESFASASVDPSTSTSSIFPEPLDLAVQVGDDSYFVRSNALGVADGVGGWSAKPKGNPGLFSRRLMHHCSNELALLYPSTTSLSSSQGLANSAGPSSPSNSTPSSSLPFLTPAAVLAPLSSSIVDPDPVEILQRAYERTLEQSKLDGSQGASTALVALLLPPTSSSSPDSSPRLRVAHVGDCLIGIIRKDELVYRSIEQQHRFNYPFQLGPQSLTTPIKDAFKIDLPIQEGDVIVLATDGLGDNLWDEDVIEEVLRWGTDVRGMSEALAKRAQKVSESGAKAGETPFARKAAQEENRKHIGGKADDISVLVAVITGCPVPEVSPSYIPPRMPGPFFRRVV